MSNENPFAEVGHYDGDDYGIRLVSEDGLLRGFGHSGFRQWNAQRACDSINASVEVRVRNAEQRGASAERARCAAIVRAHENTDPARAFDAIVEAIEGGGS